MLNGLIYDLSRYSRSGLEALQFAQRDWSPYLVHFTSSRAMEKVSSKLRGWRGIHTDEVAAALREADSTSYGIVKDILDCDSPCLRASVPNEWSGASKRVCLSQCTLPGLFGHSERFGRFGFVFDKLKVFDYGGRECHYVDDEVYGELSRCRNGGKTFERFWMSVNKYRPVGHGGRVQDFTAEREWRVPHDLPLVGFLLAVLTPDGYVKSVRSKLLDKSLDVPVLPIDMLYNWGV